MIRQDISDWLRQMDAACVLYAVQEAARAGAKSTKYVYSILQRLLDDGVTTPEAMERRKGAKGSRMGFERDATPMTIISTRRTNLEYLCMQPLPGGIYSETGAMPATAPPR